MFISPMLLHKIDSPFDDDEYITELKLDGIRLILSKFDGKVRLYSRHHNEVTSKFPELLGIDIPDGTILDGELVAVDQNGRPDFEAMMERFQSKVSGNRIQYCVFDIIYHKGQRVRLPLIERKGLLDDVLKETGTIVKVRWMLGNGDAYFDLIKEQGLEGIVLKKVSSKYQVGKRSKDWLKVINYQYADAVITGFRKDEFGLLLAVEEDDGLKPGGIMEFIVPEAKKEFYRQFEDLIIDENQKFIFLKPEIRMRVKFRNWTKSGLLRIPLFVKYIY